MSGTGSLVGMLVVDDLRVLESRSRTFSKRFICTSVNLKTAGCQFDRFQVPKQLTTGQFRLPEIVARPLKFKIYKSFRPLSRVADEWPGHSPPTRRGSHGLPTVGTKLHKLGAPHLYRLFSPHTGGVRKQ